MAREAEVRGDPTPDPADGAPSDDRVVVVGQGYQHYRTEEAILRPYGVGRIAAVDPSDPAFGARLAVAEAILVRETPITAALIAAAPKLRVVVRYGIGVDNVDLGAAREHGVYVANVPEYGIEDVSDHALALYLAVQRRIVTRDREVRSGRWDVGQREPMRRSATLRFGLVGYGRIARAFHRKIGALGATGVLVHDPALDTAPEGCELVDLGALAERADVVSLHAPLTPPTRHLIDAAVLDRMRPGAILINTARGGLVDEAALVAAVRSGRLRAGLDVFEREPPDASNPLLALDGVVLSDHTAWYSETSVEELQAGAAQEVARVLGGSPPRAWVNRWEAAP
jgi:D-3-phosphoglycerate dehydrogenase / 2-oxoglutarate reductase